MPSQRLSATAEQMTPKIGIVPAGTDCAIDVRSSSAEVIRVSIDAGPLKDVAVEAGTSIADVMADQHGSDLMMLHLALAYLGEAEREKADAMSLETTANAMLVHLFGAMPNAREAMAACCRPAASAWSTTTSAII